MLTRKDFRQILSGSLLIAGTTVGAGMLGIPLVTASAGFWPSLMITTLAWLIMLWTGLLFMEATLWMPVGSNLLSMSKRFLGQKGRVFSGAMFLFLYYCLLVAYFAAGAPLLMAAIGKVTGTSITGVYGYLLFGAVFATIVGLGAKWIDRTNLILSIGLILSYLMLIGVGASEVDPFRLERADYGAAFFALPILFSAFGYHNIIPSLCTYFEKRRAPLRISIIVGTLFALVVYLIWQWLVIGIIPSEGIAEALAAGKPVTAALQEETGRLFLYHMGQTFAFFALITSLLGVSFSMVDFLADGFQVDRSGWRRGVLSTLTFFPPFVFVSLYPAVFDDALGVAGGIGEAILNGLIPIALVWVGRYHKRLRVKETEEGSSKTALIVIALIILLVMGIECYNLIQN